MNYRFNAVQITTIFLVIIIILLGTFRDKITLTFEESLNEYLRTETDFWLTDFINMYGSSKTASKWISHYLIFYPFYLGCHFLLINILFRKFPKAKSWFNWSLLIILATLTLGKIIFGMLNVPILAEYFSFAFHKLIALPFLLLAIEGGSYFYKLIFVEKEIG